MSKAALAVLDRMIEEKKEQKEFVKKNYESSGEEFVTEHIWFTEIRVLQEARDEIASLPEDALYKIKPLVFEKVIIDYPGYIGDGYYWTAPGYMISQRNAGWRLAGIEGNITVVDTEEEGKNMCQSHYEERLKKKLIQY